MLELSHGKALAMDSTFATNKYGVIWSFSFATFSFQHMETLCLCPGFTWRTTVGNGNSFFARDLRFLSSTISSLFLPWCASINIKWDYQLHGAFSKGRLLK
jgi:hypothetical protein